MALPPEEEELLLDGREGRAEDRLEPPLDGRIPLDRLPPLERDGGRTLGADRDEVEGGRIRGAERVGGALRADGAERDGELGT